MEDLGDHDGLAYQSLDMMSVAVDVDAPVPAQVPPPLFWWCLCQPVRPPERIGSIILADKTKDNTLHLNAYGRLVGVGPSAFKSPRLWAGVSDEDRRNAVVPKVGDYVLWNRYTGAIVSYAGHKFVLVQDDAIMMIVPDINAMVMKI